MYRLISALMIFTFCNAYAAMTCDLRVDASQYKITFEKVVSSGEVRGAFATEGKAEADAMKGCLQRGAENCKIEEKSSYCHMYEFGFGFKRICYANAVGIKKVIGHKLSLEEAKEQQEILFCDKINKCENTLFNDSKATTADLEKLAFLKRSHDCR